MRDIAITLFIAAWLPKVLKAPWIGALLFVWIGLMSPHRFGYGFAYGMPFAQIVAAVTVIGMVLSRQQARYVVDAPMIWMLLFPIWTCITYIFALEQDLGWNRWIEVMKIFISVHFISALIRTRRQITVFVAVVTASVAVFGIKGGLFTLAAGGSAKVYGPPGESFMSDNNAIAVALIMVVPLLGWLGTLIKNKWQRIGIAVAGLLCLLSILGTHSRGALLGVIAMLVYLWFKSKRKGIFVILALFIAPVGIDFMPTEWTNRMNTIKAYQADESALGRLNAWQNAINIANDRPLVGGGFELYTKRVFLRYAPNPEDLHSAHSVYFQVLGEHGYVGLVIFLSLIASCMLKARRTIALSRDRPEFTWAANLSRAVQVSVLGFMVGGAFVNIAYWELLYYILLIAVFANRIVCAELAPTRKIMA